MNKTLILLLAVWALAAESAETETLKVYHLTGAIQCLEGTGIPPDQAADLLRGQGVKVVSAERRKLPQNGADKCGAPAGEANVMKVAAADWSAFLAKHPDAGGYGLWVFDETNVPVYKYDGTLQCGMGQEIPLEEMEKELRTAGIDVISSRKGTDGLVHIGVCGASTGTINVFVIDSGLLSTVRRLGYRLLVTREKIQRIAPRDAASRQIRTANGTSTPDPDRSAPPGPVPLLW